MVSICGRGEANESRREAWPARQWRPREGHSPQAPLRHKPTGCAVGPQVPTQAPPSDPPPPSSPEAGWEVPREAISLQLVLKLSHLASWKEPESLLPDESPILFFEIGSHPIVHAGITGVNHHSQLPRCLHTLCLAGDLLFIQLVSRSSA